MPMARCSNKRNVLPFEPTIRIQIDLPGKRKTVLRMSPEACIDEVHNRLCEKEDLYPYRYVLCDVRQPTAALNQAWTIAGTGTTHFRLISWSDMHHFSRDESTRLHKVALEKKKRSSLRAQITNSCGGRSQPSMKRGSLSTSNIENGSSPSSLAAFGSAAARNSGCCIRTKKQPAPPPPCAQSSDNKTAPQNGNIGITGHSTETIAAPPTSALNQPISSAHGDMNPEDNSPIDQQRAAKPSDQQSDYGQGQSMTHPSGTLIARHISTKRNHAPLPPICDDLAHMPPDSSNSPDSGCSSADSGVSSGSRNRKKFKAPLPPKLTASVEERLSEGNSNDDEPLCGTGGTESPIGNETSDGSDQAVARTSATGQTEESMSDNTAHSDDGSPTKCCGLSDANPVTLQGLLKRNTFRHAFSYVRSSDLSMTRTNKG